MNKRVEVLIDVELISEKAGVPVTIKSKTRDISAGGMKVYLTIKLPKKEEMAVQLLLPNKTTVTGEAVVVDSPLIGVVGDKGQDYLYETRFQFQKMSAEEKQKIIKYVHSAENKPPA